MADQEKTGLDLTEAEIDRHLDAVLRASGSALRHYSMTSTKADMRAAMLAFARSVQEACK